jgi:amino acid permease
VEHTQMHPVLKKGTKISIILAILVEFLVISLFHENKIPIVDMKVQVSSNFSIFFLENNEITKLYEEWKIVHFQV